MDEIDTLLESYHYDVLAEMAAAAGLAVGNGSRRPNRNAVRDAMRAAYFTRQRVLASLQQLDARERAVLNRLLLRGGTALTSSLRREVVRARIATEASPPRPDSRGGYVRAPYEVPYAPGEYAGSPRHGPSDVFEDVVARLTYHGLVFSRYAQTETWPGIPPKLRFHPAGALYIPEAVRAHLPEPRPVQDAALHEPGTLRQGEPALLLRDLYLYWDFVRWNDVRLTKGGFVVKRALRAINERLLVPDPLLDDAHSEAETGRLALLGQLLLALDLVRPHDGHLRVSGEDTLRTPELWGWDEARQLAACLEAWPKVHGVQELGREAAPYEPQNGEAREALLQVLRRLPAGRWFEPEEVLDRLHDQDPGFLFVEHSRIQSSRSDWYFGYSSSAFYGPSKTLLQTLDRFEAEFIGACLAGFLSQTGVVELGYEGEQLVSFRLTPTGRALLGQEPVVASQPEPSRVILQPNFQLIALGPVSLAVLARLDVFADRERADRGAFEYRLSRDSVYRAQQAGMDVAAIICLLEETCAVELPQNVRRSLEEWAAHHERIVFRRGVSLLQAATPELLACLVDGPETGSFLARAVTPEVAFLAASGVDGLTAALVRQGLFPAISGADPQSADGGIIAAEDGALRPVHAVPSLHLRGRLARLAEEGRNGDGTWRLTPASVHRAGGNRPRVLRLLEELGKLHRGLLPQVLVERIKAWGGYYGDATVGALTLIEFRDLTALDELRARPDLMELLTPFSAGNRALAAVPDERLDEVREILASLGVRLKEGLS